MECAECADEEVKAERYCDGGSPGTIQVLPNHPRLAQETDRCPQAHITEEIGEILWLWRQWRDRKSPEPGGAWDQPAGLIECFRLIDQVEWAVQKDEIEQERKRNA